MCFAAIGPVVGMMGSMVSAVGAQAQASAQASQLSHNAAVAQINADTARVQGVSESDRIAQKYRGLRGQQVAGYGKGGVVPTSGSAGIVLGETARNDWLDQNNAIWNRETEAVGFENKKQDLEAQAKATRKAGNIAAASTFLTGLGKFAGGGGGAGTPLMIE